MATRKTSKTRRTATKKRKRKTSPAHTSASSVVLAVKFRSKELKVLREAIDAHRARGSDATVSQMIRWAVMHVDLINDMPDQV